MNDMAHLEAAIALARKALDDDVGGPFGAVVVGPDGELVGRGRNRVIERHDPTAHAEIEALRDAGRRLGTHDLRECVVYASSEPCPMCLGALYWARVQRVVYAVDRFAARRAGFDDTRIYEEFALPPSERTLPLIHRPVAEAETVLRAWAKRAGRILY